MGKIGRNEPCPCGSGKKYKKCCLGKSYISYTSYDKNIIQGYKLSRGRDSKKACLLWLEVWDELKDILPEGITDAKDLNYLHDWHELPFNWLQDLESELERAGEKDSSFYMRRVQYCGEICEQFPDSDWLMIHNMKQAMAESYYALGRIEEGKKLFAELAEQFPCYPWPYIAWGDMYFLHRMSEDVPKDAKKAKNLYEKALKRCEDDYDRGAVRVRIEDIEKLENRR